MSTRQNARHVCPGLSNYKMHADLNKSHEVSPCSSCQLH